MEIMIISLRLNFHVCVIMQFILLTKGKWLAGEPTEVALVEEAIINGKDKNVLDEKMKRVAEIPFDSEKKFMITVHKISTGYRVICKGAPEVVMKMCTECYNGGIREQLKISQKNDVIANNTLMAENALRVLAIAYKDALSWALSMFVSW